MEIALFGATSVPGVDYRGSAELLLHEDEEHRDEGVSEPDEEHWAWWLDADALITNSDIRLEDIVDAAKAVHAANRDPASAERQPTLELILSRDCNRLNAGSYLIRRSAWSRRYLSHLWMLRSEMRRIDPDRLSEQDAMVYLLETSDEVRNRAVYAPQKVLNGNAEEIQCTEWFEETREKGASWELGDFVIHFAGAWAHKKKILEANGMSEEEVGGLDKFDAETFLMEKYWGLSHLLN